MGEPFELCLSLPRSTKLETQCRPGWIQDFPSFPGINHTKSHFSTRFHTIPHSPDTLPALVTDLSVSERSIYTRSQSRSGFPGFLTAFNSRAELAIYSMSRPVTVAHIQIREDQIMVTQDLRENQTILWKYRGRFCDFAVFDSEDQDEIIEWIITPIPEQRWEFRLDQEDEA